MTTAIELPISWFRAEIEINISLKIDSFTVLNAFSSNAVSYAITNQTEKIPMTINPQI